MTLGLPPFAPDDGVVPALAVQETLVASAASLFVFLKAEDGETRKNPQHGPQRTNPSAPESSEDPVQKKDGGEEDPDEEDAVKMRLAIGKHRKIQSVVDPGGQPPTMVRSRVPRAADVMARAPVWRVGSTAVPIDRASRGRGSSNPACRLPRRAAPGDEEEDVVLDVLVRLVPVRIQEALSLTLAFRSDLKPDIQWFKRPQGTYPTAEEAPHKDGGHQNHQRPEQALVEGPAGQRGS